MRPDHPGHGGEHEHGRQNGKGETCCRPRVGQKLIPWTPMSQMRGRGANNGADRAIPPPSRHSRRTVRFMAGLLFSLLDVG
jgi:hypothetical protein